MTVVNSDKSKDPFMQRCLHQLWFTAAVYDCQLTARHIPDVHNILADVLSHYDDICYASAASLSRQFTFRTVPSDCFTFQAR